MANYEELLKTAPKKEAADFFELDDRTEKISEFFEKNSKNKNFEGPKLPLPTEIDPKAAEELEWIKNNMETVFPNILSK